MSDVKWTKEQSDVITLRDRNLLVSAAAGSGKTATLVARIINWISSEELHGSVDRLLILTFTKAAAAEMKERIDQAVAKALEEKPGDAHLQRQSALIHRAQISTIDSFCLYVIHSYSQLLSIDPGFRVGDDAEMNLLKQDTVKAVLEEAYEEAKPGFIDFVEAYASGKNDDALEAMILKLASFADGNPYPDRWLANCGAELGDITAETLEESEMVREVIDHVHALADHYLRDLDNMKELCMSVDGPYFYQDTLLADESMLVSLKNAASFEEMRDIIRMPFAMLKGRAKKADVIDTYKQEKVKKMREIMKKDLTQTKERFFAFSLADAAEHEAKAGMQMQELISLTKRYLKLFSEKKRSRNLVDFSDLEHMALQILVQDVAVDENGNMIVLPTDAAIEMSEQFDEIMIDEYQDSNVLQEVILRSISKERQGNPNIFMVGDVKQSIYSFRLARPDLFLEKLNTYSEGESKYQKIDLHKNFRSRNEVLQSVNHVFKQIMVEGMNGPIYDKNASLYYGDGYPEEEKFDYTSELLLVQDSAEKSDSPDEEKLELEAVMIAGKIREIVGNAQIYDKDVKGFRPCEYGDIVILMRSVNKTGPTFVRVLSDMGIPVYTESRVGYFDTAEIRTVLDLLRITDNPKQDIPLVSVMTSMIGGFTDEDLARIRSLYPEISFYDAVEEAYEGDAFDDLTPKLQRFFSRLRDYRSRAKYLPIHQLISYVLKDSGYGDYAEVMPGGLQRKANLQMLIEKAVAFENTSYHGLFHFVRYMDQLHTYEEDMGEASIAGEGAKAVRVMSIHKSKGLEFPIVFVANVHRGFNEMDLKEKIVLHVEEGIGADYVDSVRRTSAPTLRKKLLQRKKRLEMVSEEQRILYVAMTRAKEKLFMTGVIKADKEIPTEAEEPDIVAIRDAGNYLDWILPTVPECRWIKCKIYQPEDVMGEALEDQIVRDLTKDAFLHLMESEEVKEEEITRLAEILKFDYPYEKEILLPKKISVSELKHEAMELLGEEENEAQIDEAPKDPDEKSNNFLDPAFIRAIEEKSAPANRADDIDEKTVSEKTLSGAERGSAYHRVMELVPFEEMTHTEKIKEYLAHLCEEGLISEAARDCVNPWDVYDFCRTDLAKRMSEAREKGFLYTEQPFVFSMPACEIHSEWESTMPILIQGIIDAFFYEEDEIVIMDYKTDRVDSAEELAQRYKAQLDYYERALSQITGKKVKERMIYSFRLKEVINV